MTSELIAILEKEAAAEAERILADARSQAEEIAADARAEADGIRETARRRAEAERKAAQTRALSAAQLKASSLVLHAKDAAIAEVFERAHRDLARRAQDRNSYPRLLRALIKEASAELSGRLIIEVNPSDADAARQAARELGLDAEVKPSAEVSGGVVVSTTDGRFVVQNTLASRLERVKPTLATEVANLLWGRS
ncbi:MAG TPA: V-type ATP synthase subunit E [bacterium]|jgi:V/A-type H+-transporting ATPase subunit E|nr:V-type ATP synthase subunit E [bacterium]